MLSIVGIGQDAHRFLTYDSLKPCVIGGVTFPGVRGMDADSDGDVVLHALCNAISSVTHIPILGQIAIDMCHQEGITDSRRFLAAACDTLNGKWTIAHISLSIEGKQPRFEPRAEEMRTCLAQLLAIAPHQIGITFVSGQNLTEFGKGLGIQCFAAVTFVSCACDKVSAHP